MLTELFTPKKIGSCTIPNRLVVPAMVTNYCTENGMITERYIRYMEEKAKGGFGLLITEDYAVEERGKGYKYIPGLYNDEQIEGSRKLTNRIHQYPSKIFCQIYHPGRQNSPAVNGGVQPIAPSPSKCPLCMSLAREMSVDEIQQMVRNFGDAAGRAKKAGFDGIEVHAAHGYLISSFLSPLVNKRTDEYGGCFDNRVRFLDEIYAAVRKAVGEDFPVIVRVSRNEFVMGGRTEAETYELSRHMEELGFDGIHITNGIYQSPPLGQAIGPMFLDHGFNMDAAEQIRKMVSVPVIVTNRINDPHMADTIIKMEKADFIGMGRGSITDPYLPKKARAGKFDQIRYCVACLQGCEMELFLGNCVTCLVNPSVGREYEDNLKSAAVSKKVMVIGGGPAGLMAAETAAKRGHKVTVYEAQDHLGGQFRSAAYPVGKGELATFVSSLRKSLEVLHVPVHLGTEVTEEMIQSEKPDAVVVATGARSLMPPIPGLDGSNVCTAEDVLLGRRDIPNGPVIVCGGGEVGGETAGFIAQTNHDVTVLEMRDEILMDMMPINRAVLADLNQKAGVRVLTGAKVAEVENDGVVYTDKNGSRVKIPAALVVSAFGYQAYDPISEIAGKYCGEVCKIGCSVKAGNALTAVREGYEAGIRI